MDHFIAVVVALVCISASTMSRTFFGPGSYDPYLDDDGYWHQDDYNDPADGSDSSKVFTPDFHGSDESFWETEAESGQFKSEHTKYEYIFGQDKSFIHGNNKGHLDQGRHHNDSVGDPHQQGKGAINKGNVYNELINNNTGDVKPGEPGSNILHSNYIQINHNNQKVSPESSQNSQNGSPQSSEVYQSSQNSQNGSTQSSKVYQSSQNSQSDSPQSRKVYQSSGPTTDADGVIFPALLQDFNSPTQPPSPTPSTTQPPFVTTARTLPAALRTMLVCLRNCPVTSEYNPVCSSTNFTYNNDGVLNCARKCGVNVTLSSRGPCGRPAKIVEKPGVKSVRNATSEIKPATQNQTPMTSSTTKPTLYTNIVNDLNKQNSSLIEMIFPLFL